VPYLRIDKGIELRIIIHRGTILVKLDGFVIMVFQQYNQTVVIERKIGIPIDTVTVNRVKIIRNSRLDPVSVGKIGGVWKHIYRSARLISYGDPGKIIVGTSS
jgi:hypothetical protein